MTDPRRFVAALVSEGVTHLVAIPSLLRAMVPAMTACGGELPELLLADDHSNASCDRVHVTLCHIVDGCSSCSPDSN